MAQYVWRDIADRSPSLAILNHIFRYPTFGFSPDRLANTTPSLLCWDWITMHASSDRGRSDAPVLVSVSRAVRRGRSTSDHRRPSTSPRRQPVNTISHVAAMADFQMSSWSALESAMPSMRYSPSVSRRSRRPVANLTKPCAELSIR
jgi:hypothetical protein